MNTSINKIAEAASLLGFPRRKPRGHERALTDAWNSLTDEQKRDFTANVGNYDQVAVAISIEGDSARLVDDDWHRMAQTARRQTRTCAPSASLVASTGARGTSVRRGTAQTPKKGVSYRPLCSQGDDTTRKHVPGGSTAHGAAPSPQR